ncbi:MAG: GNAT family N-acetyltransferase [Pseudomonadota bacterium]
MIDLADQQEVSLRRGRAEDAAACAAILNDRIDQRDWMTRTYSPEDIAAFYADFVFVERQVWVSGNPVAGFMALDESGQQVTALYVAKPGRGLGKRFLDLAKTGRTELAVWTYLANRGARRFYAREGFREIRQVVDDADTGLTEVLMRWERGDD